MSVDRVDAVVLGQPLGDERDDLVQRGARVVALDQEQVAPHALGGGERRRLALADRVGAAARSCCPAAWRKMCVSSATGTGRASPPARRTACRRRPARAGRRRRRARRACRGPTARSSVTSSSRFAIEVSSTTSRSRARVLVARRPLAGDPAERGVDRRRGLAAARRPAGRRRDLDGQPRAARHAAARRRPGHARRARRRRRPARARRRRQAVRRARRRAAACRSPRSRTSSARPPGA